MEFDEFCGLITFVWDNWEIVWRLFPALMWSFVDDWAQGTKPFNDFLYLYQMRHVMGHSCVRVCVCVCVYVCVCVCVCVRTILTQIQLQLI